jgi:hypothetical protein
MMVENRAKIVALLALSFGLSVMAQEYQGWQFDSLHVHSSVLKSDAQQIYEVLLKMLDRWNAHDISKQTVVANTTMNLQKLNEGWKIVDSHTSVVDM